MCSMLLSGVTAAYGASVFVGFTTSLFYHVRTTSKAQIHPFLQQAESRGKLKEVVFPGCTGENIVRLLGLSISGLLMRVFLV